MIFTTLIEPRELHAFMLNQKVSGNRNIIILDCSCSIPDPELGIKLYAKEHIPGAVLVDFDRYVTGKVAQGTGRHPMPGRETFRQSMEYFGIRPDRQVVLYDQGGLGFATRFWYELRWLGLENVCVLDGGFTAWKEEKLPVTDKPTEPLEDGKIPELAPLEVPVPMKTVQDNLKTKEFLEVDARPALRFQGIGETIDHKAGHIPGAVLLPVGTIDETTAAEVIPEKDSTVLVYCRSGNRSKTASSALADLGYTNIYEFGGINTWPYETEP